MYHRMRVRLPWYVGTWGFRDFFTTTAEHHVWVDGSYSFHLVKVNSTAQREIMDAAAVWVGLMSDQDPYNFVVTKTRDGAIQRIVVGISNQHYFDEYLLDKYGWISLYQPLKGQKGSPAMNAPEYTHPVRPRSYDAQIDNIELHTLNPREVRTPHAGDYFERSEHDVTLAPFPDYGVLTTLKSITSHYRLHAWWSKS
ncbi:MAG: hypothetical protein ACE5GD_07205 [Candidatus Geothermarchaeales archaeon]